MFVYILASKPNGVLYVGVTNDLVRRVWEYKNDVVPGFTKKYGVKELVYFEICDDPSVAIAREKQIKRWNRAWKVRRILECNPLWRDLYEDITK